MANFLMETVEAAWGQKISNDESDKFSIYTTQEATEHQFLLELSKHLVKPGLYFMSKPNGAQNSKRQENELRKVFILSWKLNLRPHNLFDAEAMWFDLRRQRLHITFENTKIISLGKFEISFLNDAKYDSIGFKQRYLYSKNFKFHAGNQKCQIRNCQFVSFNSLHRIWKFWCPKIPSFKVLWTCD